MSIGPDFILVESVFDVINNVSYVIYFPGRTVFVYELFIIDSQIDCIKILKKMY